MRPGQVPDLDLTAAVSLVVGLDGAASWGPAVLHEDGETDVLQLAEGEENLEIVHQRYSPLADDLLDINGDTAEGLLDQGPGQLSARDHLL